AEGGPGRRRDPPLPPAGALQGQGREIRQRVYLPQGRQEEVTERAMTTGNKKFSGRRLRVRKALRRVGSGRARLSVFRSSKHIYAQVIDDVKGHTLAQASSIEPDFR